MVERSLSMREARGSIPRSSTFFMHQQLYLFYYHLFISTQCNTIYYNSVMDNSSNLLHKSSQLRKLNCVLHHRI